MAADDFQIKPTWVHIIEPAFYNIVTTSESQKKEYYNLGSDPVETFRLVFIGLSDLQAKTIYDHYKGRYGGYDAFAWKNAYIPDYLITKLGLGSSDLAGRWVDGTYKETIKARSVDVEIVFEKQIS